MVHQKEHKLNSILCGKLLGDGYLLKKKNARLQFRHSIKDKEYVEEQLALFSRFLPFGPNNPAEYTYKDQRTQKRYTMLICQSKTDDRLTQLMSLWYDAQGRKVLPRCFLKDYFNEESLAIWYQDDGYLKTASRILLSTECFSDDELSFLQGLIEEKFGVNSTIDSQRRIDIHTRRDVELFLCYVSPYISKGMQRKSLTSYYEKLMMETHGLLTKPPNEKLEWQRTTIYIPAEIKQELQTYPSPSKELYRRLSVLEELEKIHDPLFRRKRILEAKKPEQYIRDPSCLRPYTLHLEKHHYLGLKLLKQWTGIEISEYVMMLMSR